MDVQPDNPTDTRLGHIVRLLSDNATVVISGTRIAEELGTTRSEVWRAVQQLRDLGVQITGHPSTGYQLEAVPDLLLPDILGPMLSGHDFRSPHSSLFPHRIDQRRPPCNRRRRANRKAPCSSPNSKLPVADAAETHGSRHNRSASTALWCCVRRVLPETPCPSR